MKNYLKIAFPILFCVLATACNDNKKQDKMNTEKSELNEIFPSGKKDQTVNSSDIDHLFPI